MESLVGVDIFSKDLDSKQVTDKSERARFGKWVQSLKGS